MYYLREEIHKLIASDSWCPGMSCSMKTTLGELLADALRYYYFDRCMSSSILNPSVPTINVLDYLFCSLFSFLSSDGLVEQAAGGEAAAKSFRDTDEKGFRDSEVYGRIHNHDHDHEIMLHV